MMATCSTSSSRVWPGERFEAFAERVLVLDSGRAFQLHPFQRWLLEPFFSGCQESILSTAKGNGKSTTLGGLALYELLTSPEAEIVVCAASRDQASVLLGQAQGFVRRSRALSRRLRLTRRDIEHPALRGRVRVISADASTGDGLIPTLVLADELHRWRSADLFETLQTALAKRRGRMLTISTAGVKDDACPLWPIRERALTLSAHREGVYLRADSDEGSFALRELSAPVDADWRDLDVAAAVNPLVPREVLAQRFSSPTQNERSWRRFTLNQWLEPAVEESAINPQLWAQAADLAVSPIAPACFGIDATPDRAAACVAVAAFDGSGADRRIVVEVVEHGTGVAWIVDRAVQLDERHDTHLGFVLDGAGPAAASIPRLAEFGIEPHVTGAREYARACATVLDLLAEGRLAHRDQPPLNLAVQAASRRRLTDGFAWSRSGSLGDISPLVAVSLAVWGLVSRGPVSEEAYGAI